MRLFLLMLLTASLCHGQVVKSGDTVKVRPDVPVWALDDSTIAMNKDEFKRVIQVNIDRGTCDSLLDNQKQQIRIQDEIIALKDSTIGQERKAFSILKQAYDDREQPWYDTFAIGSITGIIVTGVILWLTH